MDADDGIDEECQLEAVYYGRREGGAGRATDGQAGEGRERTIRKKSPPYISFLWGLKGFLGRLSAAGRLVASGREAQTFLALGFCVFHAYFCSDERGREREEEDVVQSRHGATKSAQKMELPPGLSVR